MNIADRKKRYLEYVARLEQGNKITSEMASLLFDAFNVTTSDIVDIVNSIQAGDGEASMQRQTAHLMVLMETLKDFRDTAQINLTASEIRKHKIDCSDLKINADYLFLS